MNRFKSVSAPGRKGPSLARQELSAAMVHEVKNQIQAAKGLMQWMILEFADSEKFLYYSQMVIQQLDSANERLNIFMDLDNNQYSPTLCSLAELCHSIVTLMQGMSILQGISIEENYAYTTPLLLEGKSLKQILLNLLKNALDASPRGGTIIVSTTVQDELILLQVMDHGIGMDEQTRENIFKPFYTTKEEGSGLGLPICRHMAENLAGSLDVESVPGEGSVFTLALPLIK